MKTALDFYARGKQKEANADEYDRSRYYSKDRFICPECGEPVHLTGSRYSNHFAHFKKSDISAECDRRVDGNPTTSVYDRIGLPIYMRKNATGDFCLYMGFKALPNMLMDKAISDSITVNIDRKNTYRINRERFSCEETAMIPLEYVPLSGHKYHLSYEPANKSYAVSQHWSDYADGFSYEGALFTVTDQGGKKIRHGDSVTTEEKYYWVRRQPQLPSFISGIKMEKCGRLILKDAVLNVFSGSFSSDISDVEFSYLTSYLRNNLKIHLLEKKPEFIPIWPPVIKSEDGYIVNSKDQNIYGYIMSGNDEPKIYVYNGIRKIPDELDSVDNVTCVKVWDQEALVNIDRKYISNGTLLLKRKRDIRSHKSDVYELIDNEYVSVSHQKIYNNGSIVTYNVDKITDFVLIRNNGTIEVSKGLGTICFENLTNNDMVFALQNKYLISALFVEIEEKTDSEGFDDAALYQMFEEYRNSKKVRLPYKIRIHLYELKDEVKLSRKYVEDVLKDNCISAILVNKLGELFDE